LQFEFSIYDARFSDRREAFFVPPTCLLLAVLFESPLVAAAIAGGAVAVPVVIHLLNRRRFKVVTWAAMRFLLAAQRKNTRRMRLEQLLLLAVRCLVVLLIVAAMASVTPWAEAVWHRINPEGGVAVDSGGGRRYKVLVIDGSLSMAQRPGRGAAPAGDRPDEASCFDKARDLAARLVRESPGGDGFSVVLMGAPPRRVVPEPSEDSRKVAAEVEALKLPHGNADLAATLSAVESLLQAAPDKFGEREVYFFSDLQQSTWVARQPAGVAALLQKIQTRARTALVDVGRDGVNNLAVTGLALDEDVATPGRTTTVVATLQNFGGETREVRVSLLVGRARAVAADAPFELRPVQEAVVRAERGQQVPVAFSYKFPSDGEYVLQVQAESDALDLDDTRSAVVTVKQDVPVLLVNGKPAGQAFDQATEWLRVALNPFDSVRPPAGVVARPKVIGAAAFADEGQGDLTPYDCVFLCDLPALTLAETRRLEGHLRRGGGVVFFLGDQVQPGEYNRVLYRGGQGLLPAALLSKQNATDGYDYQLLPEEESDREPPLRAFQGANDRAALVAARFRRFYQLGEPTTGSKPRKILSYVPVAIAGVEARGAKSPPPAGGVAALAWSPPAGEGAGRRNPADPTAGRYRGRVVLLNASSNSDWGNWPASPSYPAFVQELLPYASAGRLHERESPVGDPLELFLPNLGGADATVYTPDGRSETARAQGLEDGAVLRWSDTDMSGIYRAVLGSGPREHLFAVNVPVTNEAQQAGESNLARTSREELGKVYPEWDVQVVHDPAQVARTVVTATGARPVLREQGTQIARWVLLAVLALALAEVVVAWHFGRHTEAERGTSTSGQVVGQRSAGSFGTRAARVALRALPVLLFAVALAVGGVLAHDAVTGDFLGFLPDPLRRSAEAWLGVPEPAEGEGTRWRLEYSPYFLDSASDPWLAATVAAGALALAAFAYRRELRGASRGLRVILVGLRLVFVLLLLVVLLPRLRLWFERQGWPDVALLLDDSQSMSARDHYRDPAVRDAAARLASVAGLAEADRLRLAQTLITRPEQDWLRSLLTRRQVRLHVYHCSGQAHRLQTVSSGEDMAPAAEAIAGLNADPGNDSSQLGAAVRQVLNDFRGSSLAAVVMFTDGVTTEGEDLAKASKYAAQAGVPLYFVGVGDAHEVRDVYLHDLRVEDSVFARDRLVFELKLTAQGYTNLSVPVVLYEKGKEDTPLDTQTVKADPTGKPVKVRLTCQPSEPGEKIFVIKTPAQPDEVEKDNNRLERPVFVREAKLIKVLYVEGYRRYEYHYLKTLLERESDRSKGNKSIDLKVLLFDSDPDFAVQDRSAISYWPSKAELNTFDVVILGDVDPHSSADPKMSEHLKDLADFVNERGGGLLMIAGERHAPAAYRDTPLRDVLPVDVTGERPGDAEEAPRTEGYRPVLTPVGRTHPVFRFSPDEKENDEIYDRLREMYWWADGVVPKRAAEVLAVHPSRRGARGAERGAPDAAADAAATAADGVPLVVQQFVGAGRVLYLGFDETWRWGFREDQLRFNQFWVQAVRYLARSRVGRIELRVDRQTPYRRGEPIKLTVRFPDDTPPPPPETEVKVVVERRVPGRPGEADVRTVQLNKVDGSRAAYEAVLTRTPEGEYKFWLSQPGAVPKPRAEGRVLAPPGEMDRLRMNQEEMQLAAEETHGRFYTLADADRIPEDLPSGSRVTVRAPGPPFLLWNHAALFAVALLFLTSEWLLRKEKNLL
jgi:hypothetical protein